MPAPKNPNTLAARDKRAANVRRRKLEAAAELLRAAGAVVVLPGEAPVFVLCGTDELTVPTMLAYRGLCKKSALLPRARVVDQLALRVRDWQRENQSKVSTPNKSGVDLRLT